MTIDHIQSWYLIKTSNIKCHITWWKSKRKWGWFLQSAEPKQTEGIWQNRDGILIKVSKSVTYVRQNISMKLRTWFTSTRGKSRWCNFLSLTRRSIASNVGHFSPFGIGYFRKNQNYLSHFFRFSFKIVSVITGFKSFSVEFAFSNLISFYFGVREFQNIHTLLRDTKPRSPGWNNLHIS